MDYLGSMLNAIIGEDYPVKKEATKDLESGNKVETKSLEQQKKEEYYSKISSDLESETVEEYNRLFNMYQLFRGDRYRPLTISELKDFLYNKGVVPPFPEKIGKTRSMVHPLFVIADGCAKLETTDLSTGADCKLGNVEIMASVQEQDPKLFLIDFKIMSVTSSASFPLEFKLSCEMEENTEWLPCSMLEKNEPIDETKPVLYVGLSPYKSLLDGFERRCGPMFIRDDIWALFLGDRQEHEITGMFEFEDQLNHKSKNSHGHSTGPTGKHCYMKNTLEITIVLIYIQNVYKAIDPEFSKSIELCIFKSTIEHYRIDAHYGNEILAIVKFNLRKTDRTKISIRVRRFDYAAQQNMHEIMSEKTTLEITYVIVYRRLGTAAIFENETKEKIPVIVQTSKE